MLRVQTEQERLDAPAVAAAKVDDRLIAVGQLSAQQRDCELAVPDRKIRRLGRALGALEIRASDLPDAAARDRTFHAIAASCDRVTRAVKPPSRRSMKVWTSPASH